MEQLSVYINRAEQLLDLKRYVEAMAEAKKVLAIEPLHQDALGILVNAAAFGGKLEQAVRYGKNALQHYPEDDYLYFGLGVASLHNGFADQAEEYFKAAIHFMPWNAAYHSNLAVALMAQKKWKQALSVIDKSLEVNPNSDFAHNIKAQILQEHRSETAQESLNEATRLSPNNQLNHKIQADFSFRKKDYEQAAFHYQQALKTSPDRVDLREDFLRALAYSYPWFKNVIRFYPYHNKTLFHRIFSLGLLAIFLLVVQYPFHSFPMIVPYFSLPVLCLLVSYWFGEPLLRYRLFEQHFNQKNYPLANPFLPVQTLVQLSIVALGLALFFNITELKILIFMSLGTGGLVLSFMLDRESETARLHFENPWLMTLVWGLFAILIPLTLWLKEEEVPTEGLI